MCFCKHMVTDKGRVQYLLQVLGPNVVLRPELVQDVVLSMSSEAFVEPKVVPPLHCHEVAEPHVRHFMGNSPSIPLEEFGGHGLRVAQKDLLLDSDAAPILHCSVLHYVESHKVQLWERILYLEVVFV